MDDKPIKVFYSYSRKDDILQAELSRHLSPLRHTRLIDDWSDRSIVPGEEWDDTIRARLNEADIILLLVSADYLASEYCYGKEAKVALERHRSKATIVIAILLRPVDIDSTPLSGLRLLPRNRNPIASWSDREQAFAEVAREIRAAVERAHGSRVGSRLQRLKSMLSRSSVAPPAVISTSQTVSGYLAIRFECPTCGHPWRTTFLNAGATFRCRACRCEDLVPNELPLLGIALHEGNVTTDTVMRVLRRKLARQDITLTAPLLAKDPGGSSSVDLLTSDDIIREYRLQGGPEKDDDNALVHAMRLGLLHVFERHLEEALDVNFVFTPEDLATARVSTVEELTRSAQRVADVMLQLAREDAEKRRKNVSLNERSSFSHARLLLISCQSDNLYGTQLETHLMALKHGGTIDQVRLVVVDAPDATDLAIWPLTRPFHIIAVLLSPAMLATTFAMRGLAELLTLHGRRDLVLVPIVVQTMAWQKLDVSKLQVLPASGRPLSSWSAIDEACVEIVEALRRVISTVPSEIIVKAAERGDGHAKVMMAIGYLLGQGVRTNGEKAVYWMDRAAEAREDAGTRFLAATLLENRDPTRAVEWMRRSAEAGHVDAMIQLAVWYENGRAKLEVDPTAALDWFTRAAKTGDVKSMYEVARMLQQGLGTAKDVANAIVWLERAAESGMPVAMLKLGNCYCLGVGIVEDHAKAAEWWRRAAETGDKETIEMLRNQGYLI